MTIPASAKRRQKGLAVSFVNADPPSDNSSPVVSISSADSSPPTTSSSHTSSSSRTRARLTRTRHAQRKSVQTPAISTAPSSSSASDLSGKPASKQELEVESPAMNVPATGTPEAKRWSVPYDASEGEEVQVHIHKPARRHGRGSPSPSRRDLPRLDFSRTSTPLRAKSFASTPLKSALASSTSSSSPTWSVANSRETLYHRDTLYVEDDSPGKVDRPGRQISLNGLDFFDAAELEKVANIDAAEGLETLAEAEEPTVAVHIMRPGEGNRSAAPTAGTPPSQAYRPRSFVRGLPRSGSESSFVSALSVKGVLCRAEASYTDVLDAYTGDTEGEEDGVPDSDAGYGSEGDADAVDLTLDFDGLSIITNRNAHNSIELMDPPRTPRAASNGFAEVMSGPASSTSSSSSPPTTVPSVPGTPVQEINEVSDSDDWIPQAPRSVRRRRILDSDDEAPAPKTNPRSLIYSDDSSPIGTRTEPQTPQAPARRNRLMGTPAALQRLLDLDAHGEEEDTYAEAGDDTFGSLKDFIVDDDEISDEGEVNCIDMRGSRNSPIDLMDSEDEDEDEDAGVIRYSPTPGPLALPDIGELNLDDSDDEAITAPREKIVPPPRRSSTQWSKKEWLSRRETIANNLFAELDAKVFDSRLGATGAGAFVEWNNRLLTTAGTAHKSRNRSTGQYSYKIKLSDKVCTGESQIVSTLAHEMCHLACWIISNEHKSPHGRVFKSWGAKVMRYRPDIEVTTRHSYEIEYKYEWECSNAVCGKIYRRHSKSIDPTKQVCGSCKGRLVPRFQTQTSPFQVYLKNNMALAKSALPGASHGDVMRALSKRWTDAVGATEEEHVQYWRCAAGAARTTGTTVLV